MLCFIDNNTNTRNILHRYRCKNLSYYYSMELSISPPSYLLNGLHRLALILPIDMVLQPFQRNATIADNIGYLVTCNLYHITALSYSLYPFWE